MSDYTSISVGCDDFRTFLLHNDVYVDKSLLLKEVVADDGTTFLITRPRRWGKSLNLSMIQRFLEIEVDEGGAPIPIEQSINRKLFVGGIIREAGEVKKLQALKISSETKVMRQQGLFPVIRISFKEVNGTSITRIEEQLIRKLKVIYS